MKNETIVDLDVSALRSLDHHSQTEAETRVRFMTMMAVGEDSWPLCVVSLRVASGKYAVASSGSCPDAASVMPFARAWGRCKEFIDANGLTRSTE